ncbi:MAG: NHL repeat-containing protein, partial [Patescibacteria group bacterium]
TIADGEPAINVLGQSDFISSVATTTQSGLNGPNGVTFNSLSSTLFVADYNNHRIMVFNVATIADGEPAINVLGQSDFISFSAGTTKSGLNNPFSVVFNSASNTLFVADYTNNRVVIYNVASIVDGEDAVNVLGQTDGGLLPVYTTSGADNPGFLGGYAGLNSLSGLLLDTVNHRLFVADSSNNRVLVFNLDTDNNLADRVADYVLGQPDFTSVTASTSQSGLAGPRGLAYNSASNTLFVADENNGRVLIFDVASTTDGESAINVLGQVSFITNEHNVVSQTSLSYPSGLAYNSASNTLFVADESIYRVMVFNVASITDNEPAINVLGQADFVSNVQTTTQSSISSPGLAYDSASNTLFVVDYGSQRIMVFNVASITDNEPAINV